MKCEYKVERISDDLEKYLNEKGSQGWRCASVTIATGLGWTHIVVLERDAGDQPVDTEIKIVESKPEEDDEKLNGKAKSILEVIAKLYVVFEYAWVILNIRALLDPDYSTMDIQIKLIILFIMIIVDLILLFVLNKQNEKGEMKNDEIQI